MSSWPSFRQRAHAALLATVVAAYDAAARRASTSAKETETAKKENGFFFEKAPELPAPSPRLARALESALASLTRGAGKRPLGAGYRAAVERLRDVDAACRRLSHSHGSGTGSEKKTISARDVASRVAAPCVSDAQGALLGKVLTLEKFEMAGIDCCGGRRRRGGGGDETGG